MAQSRNPRIAIIGAGIGGVTACVALQRAGAAVSIYEQADALTEVGAGVVLGPNATRVLEHLGLGASFWDCTVEPQHLHLRRWQDGRTVTRQLLGAAARAQFGSRYVTAHRADLLDALTAALAPQSLNLGYRLRSLQQGQGGIDLEWHNGEHTHADVVIGADGIHSTVARSIGISTVPRFSGYAAYRALLPADKVADLDLDQEQTLWLGADRHLVHYFVSGGEYLNCVAVVPSPGERESWQMQGDIDRARGHFAGWHPTVRAILDRIDSSTLWGLYDRPTRPVWHVGRTAVLGDAAHPMLPFFAQGAAQAIEDAAAIAHMLTGASIENTPARLQQYCAIRQPRAQRIQGLAFRNASMFHLPDGPDQGARDIRLAQPSGGDPFRDNAWLYGYDIEAELVNHFPIE